MAIQTNITKILEQEMDRKDFLKYGAGLLLSAAGITGLVNLLFGVQEAKDYIAASTEPKAMSSYGSSTYGR